MFVDTRRYNFFKWPHSFIDSLFDRDKQHVEMDDNDENIIFLSKT
ncbi:hypothetical protein [Sulfurimonas lithotrophica]|nr:hypothetical protein [Sulfurimonas lithotrophica]